MIHIQLIVAVKYLSQSETHRAIGKVTGNKEILVMKQTEIFPPVQKLIQELSRLNLQLGTVS